MFANSAQSNISRHQYNQRYAGNAITWLFLCVTFITMHFKIALSCCDTEVVLIKICCVH